MKPIAAASRFNHNKAAVIMSVNSIEQSAVTKFAIRLVPFLALMFFINYLDRTAISFAGPNGMNQDLGLSAAQFGFASGIFFIGYIILEVPSNLALHKFGARVWLARIMVTWGIVALLFTWVSSASGLYILRFLLGVAEAGFFPGAILFLSTWVPASHRSKILSLFYLAQPLTTVIGAPLAGALIAQHGVFGLEGWRFMFMGVAIPAIVVGIIAWFYLSDRPAQAKWLTDEEKKVLTDKLELESKGKDILHHASIRTVLFNGRVWTLALIYFGFVYGLYALAFFLPTIIAGFEAQYGTKFNVFREGPDHRDSLLACGYRPLPLVERCDQTRREDVAHCDSGCCRRNKHSPGFVYGFANGYHRRDYRHRVLDLCGAAELLDSPIQVPHRRRGGRGYCLDQHGRQHRRIRRWLHYRSA